MSRHPMLSATLLASALAATFVSAACRGEEETVPPVAQSQTATPVQETNKPVTVTGCLRAGEATGTFVLTASKTAEGQTTTAGQTATYQLHGAENVDMRSHVGKLVEVSGIVRSQQAIASRSPTTPADQRATGTSGTPTVQTSTEVALSELDVKAVKPLGENCEG